MKNNQLPVIGKEGEKIKEEPITGDFVGIEAPISLIAQSIRKFLNNQRKASANTKRRGAVAGSTIKIWKQKGTGRARHGDRQAPIFVGGGKAHGPTGEQNYKLKLSKKMSQKAVLAVLNKKIKEKEVFLIDNFEINKTKEAGIFIEKFKEKVSIKGQILLLYSSKDKIQKYFRNLSNVKIQNMENLNSYSMLRSQTLLITQNGLAAIAKKEQKND